MRARKLVGIVERIVLGTGMSLALWLAEWQLRRSQRRREPKGPTPSQPPPRDGEQRPG